MQCAPELIRQSTARDTRAPGHDLPEGFVALRDVKALPLLGRWPLLEDRMPAWLPFDCLGEMARRNDAGDPEAREWIDLHRQAVEGEPLAQRAMGIAFETGSHGAAADPQRALFWYWRASLGGDRESYESALRLKESIDVLPAAIEDPSLVYPGQWRIMRDDLQGGISTWVFNLASDGAFSARSPTRIAAGWWTYDNVAALLTVTIAASGGEFAERWEIQLLGARDPLLFGRDRRRVTYMVQRVIQDEGATP